MQNVFKQKHVVEAIRLDTGLNHCELYDESLDFVMEMGIRTKESPVSDLPTHIADPWHISF